MATLHLVPHTHWDREWYLPFQEMRIKLVHLVDRLLEILDRDPDYLHFTLDGQTSVLEDYLEVRPERRPELAARIAEGRILVGPWTVLPDEFLVSPESFVRNLARGSRTAREFGARMDVGYVPDPFGHIGQLPQILRGFGIESTVFRRGLGPEPCELWWDAPDGSRVLVSYLRDGYDNAARLPDDPEAFAAVVRTRSSSLEAHSAVSHRLLMNGSDHHEPQPEIPELLRKAQTNTDRVVFSTLPTYIAAVRDQLDARKIDLPVIRGELRDPRRHHLLPGVLSSRVWIKQRNDACERLLERWAEPLVAWADVLARSAPTETQVWTGHLETPRVRDARAFLDEAWRLLLSCHPHDSICGCSVDAVHDEMRARFDQVEQIGRELTRQSQVALAEQVDTAGLEAGGAERALVIFNPAGVVRSDVARVPLEIGPGREPFEIFDSRGHTLPHRVLRRREREFARFELGPADLRGLVRRVRDGRTLGLAIEDVLVKRDGGDVSAEVVVSEGGVPNPGALADALQVLEAAQADGETERLLVRIVFATRIDLEVAVPELPAHGHAALGVRPARRSAPEPVRDSGRRIANELLAAEVDADGTLTLEDLASGARFSGLLRLRDVGDRGDSYNFCPVDGDPGTCSGEPIRVERVVEPLAEVLEISQRLRVPRRLAPDRSRRADAHVDLPVRIRVTLAHGVGRADVEVRVDNRADDHRLSLLFPLGAPVDEASYDGHYEIVRRPTTLPRDTADWVEQPVAEQPMRSFVAARAPGSTGLLVAARGLREASVSPEGEIAVTLLRCFGWLSRGDFASRAGPAGPEMPTPGGQSRGPHVFRLGLIPFTDFSAAAAQADAFQVTPAGVGTSLHGGTLPARAALLRIEPDSFRLTAVLPGAEPGSVVVRVVNLLAEPNELTLFAHRAPALWERVRLDETPLAPLEPEADGRIRIGARAGEIVSLRLRYAN